jgi:hypothetical protein
MYDLKKSFCLLALLLGSLFSMSLPSAIAAPSSQVQPDGTITIGTSTRVLLNQSGMINITCDNGDKYEAFIPLGLVPEGKWFSTMHLNDRKITVDQEKKTTTFRGTFIAPGQPQPIPLEVSIAVREGGNVRVTMRLVTEVPAKSILTSYYMQLQSPRSQHSGQEIAVDDKKTVLTTDAPTETGIKPIHVGPGMPTITYFPADAERRLTITPVEVGEMSTYDNNRPPQPTVFTRLLPKGNTLIYDVGFSGADKVASAETYYGVDYMAANHFRLPRYGASRNLVQNSGFEAGFHWWRRGGRGVMTASRIGEYYEVQTGEAFAGNRSLKLYGEKGQAPAHLTSFAIPVETGATYTLSFYGRAERQGFPVNFSSVTAVWPVFVDKTFFLSPEWKRYEYSFQAPNEMLNVAFGIPSPAEDGVAWIDNVQLEKGPLTDYAAKPVEASVTTNVRGNWLLPGEKTGAKLELSGTPRISGNALLKMTDFFGKTVREETRPFTLAANGTAQIPLTWAEGLEAGLYLIETNVKCGEFADRDFSRLTIAPYANNSAAHKNLFAFGAEAWQLGSWARRFEFFKRAGIGSGVVFDVAPHGYLQEMQKQGMLDVSSIFKDGHFAIGKHLKEEFHLTDEELGQVETEAYEKAKAWSEITHWKTVNEPGDKMSVNLAEMKEFVKTQVAAYRGIKRANSKAIVMSPDPANMAPQSGTHWLDMFLEAGGKAACDVIAIHPYRARPEEPDMDSDLAMLIKMLDKHGYKGDIWFTEGMGNFSMNLPAWGVDVHRALSQEEGKSGGWRVGHLSYDLGFGERQAAAYAMRSWLVGLKYGDRVKHYVSWYYFNNSTLDYDFTPGAEVFAPNTLTQFLGNSSFKQDIELGEGLRGYLFEDGTKRPVAVLWSYDMRIDKGDAKGPLLDISSLPAKAEIFDFTGKKVVRAKELQLSPFPIFVRGVAGSTNAIAKTLSELPMSSSIGRQLLPFVKVTGANSAEVRLQNLLARPAQGKLQIVQEGKVLYDANVTVAGKATWANPLTLAMETGRLTPQKIRVAFQPSNGAQAQVSDISLETLAIPRASTPITVDGDLSDWPAASKLLLQRRVITWGTKPAHGGDADLSGTLYSAWDADNLYLAFNIKDDQFAPSAQSNVAWQGDGIQIYFDSFQNAGAATRPDFDSDDQNFDLWPSAGGLEVRRVVTPDVQLAFLKPGLVENAKKSFKRTADGYIIELALPKRELAPIDFKAGGSFGFSFIINDKDDEASGRKRGLTLTPDGTEPFSHPELFTVVTLRP